MCKRNFVPTLPVPDDMNSLSLRHVNNEQITHQLLPLTKPGMKHIPWNNFTEETDEC